MVRRGGLGHTEAVPLYRGTLHACPRKRGRSLRQRAVKKNIERPDVTTPGIDDVEYAFVGREGEPVGLDPQQWRSVRGQDAAKVQNPL